MIATIQELANEVRCCPQANLEELASQINSRLSSGELDMDVFLEAVYDFLPSRRASKADDCYLKWEAIFLSGKFSKEVCKKILTRGAQHKDDVVSWLFSSREQDFCDSQPRKIIAINLCHSVLPLDFDPLTLTYQQVAEKIVKSCDGSVESWRKRRSATEAFQELFKNVKTNDLSAEELKALESRIESLLMTYDLTSKATFLQVLANFFERDNVSLFCGDKPLGGWPSSQPVSTLLASHRFNPSNEVREVLRPLLMDSVADLEPQALKFSQFENDARSFLYSLMEVAFVGEQRMQAEEFLSLLYDTQTAIDNGVWQDGRTGCQKTWLFGLERALSVSSLENLIEYEPNQGIKIQYTRLLGYSVFSQILNSKFSPPQFDFQTVSEESSSAREITLPGNLLICGSEICVALKKLITECNKFIEVMSKNFEDQLKHKEPGMGFRSRKR